MASKLRLITDLYGETLTNITKNSYEWMAFLECSAMNYKYPFNDQVLIYAQRPSAIACASIETWNKSVGRWINKGSKGIALISDDSGYTNLKYVFDIADTNSRNGKSFRLWTVTKAYEKDVIESLENKYGELEQKETLPQAIKSVSKILAEDNLPDYLDDLMNYRDNSFLDGLDELNVKVRFQELLSNSIAYSMMKRCGLNPSIYFEESDFSHIADFNSYDTITRLGLATSEISEMGLREIYNTIKNLRLNEINKIRTFENAVGKEYDLYESKNIAERSDLDDNLQSSRGLRDSRFSSTEEREEYSSTREIRNDEASLFERTEETSIHDSTYERPTIRTLDGDTESSRNENRENNYRDEIQGEYNRGIESNRSNEMDRTNEQLENDSRGNSDERTNLRLNIYEKGDKHLPYVVLDEKINQILSTTPHLKKSNREIKNFFENEKDIDKRIEFLKGIFNNEYTGLTIDDEMYGYKAFDNGVLFWKGNFLSRDTESFVEWVDLTYHYDSMILLNQLNDRFKPLPSVSEQLNLLDSKEEKNVSDLEFTQEFIDKYLQERHRETKFAIYEMFNKSLSSEDNINFLKNLYGIGGQTNTVKGSGIGETHDYKGIKFNRGYFDASAKEQLFKWNYIEKRIKELIREERYLNPKEMEEYPNWLEEQLQKEN